LQQLLAGEIAPGVGSPAHNTPAMRISEAALYDQFTQARQEAVKLTDRYRDAPSDAPGRDALWEQVVNQTETARSLLECLLYEYQHGDRHPPAPEQRLYEVHAGRGWS